MKPYNENDLIRIAKRRNNAKRNYLIVNPLQGKHLPVDPLKALELFTALGEQLWTSCSTEKCLIIAFAETATAIGCAVAAVFGDNCRLVTTTREKMPDTIGFLEEHSHAANQFLCTEGLGAALSDCERIILLDDEITTGKTIINIIAQLTTRFPSIKHKKLVAASLINRMSLTDKQRFLDKKIELCSLLSPHGTNYEREAERFSCDSDRIEQYEREAFSTLLLLNGQCDVRRVCAPRELAQSIYTLTREITDAVHVEKGQRLLVLGTEELMYPAIMLGAAYKRSGVDEVYTHSTTRSPISASDEAGYPIFQANRVESPYEKERLTFIYNLRAYDKAIIVTDARTNLEGGLKSLYAALKAHGCDDISCVRWCR